MTNLSMRLLGTVALLSTLAVTSCTADRDNARVKAEAANVTITRDNYGIAHVKGHTDQEAVFGMVYAQAEDDFNRVETNYAIALGVRAQHDGAKAIWADLRQRLYIDPKVLRADYAKSPQWLKKIMIGWADGLNYYLSTHPNVKPKYIKHYEPWMALSFTEGSIGGDTERAKLTQLEAFYTHRTLPMTKAEKGLGLVEPKGSNGIAIAPKLSADGHALLWINPHTTFYFRDELQMTSDQGLDAFGASTWGQPFLYQGFNQHLGWMHTTSSADCVDAFAETVSKINGKYYYKYGNQERPMTVKNITIKYRADNGSIAKKTFVTYATIHGPIVAEENGKWIALDIMNKPIAALEQSYERTKAKTFAQYMKIANLQANSSNDTVYADDKGNIALLLPQFIPLRNNKFDYTKPVDGSNPATTWQGDTPLDQIPHVVNPKSGWVFNSNDTPQNAAGPNTIDMSKYPKYMDQRGEDPRGVHMVKILTPAKDITPQKLIKLAFDPYQPAFAKMIPALVHDYDALPRSSPLKKKLAGPVVLLKGWDYKWGYDSIANSVAVFWGDDLYLREVAAMRAAGINDYVKYLTDTASANDRLQALSDAVDKLTTDFGTWKTPWGVINRYQRLDDSIKPHFDDSMPSLPVPFDSARWGSIASFGTIHNKTKKWYGNSGNSIIAAVDFGPHRVRAWAATVGGVSGNPNSPHFKDQVHAYITGDLIPVYFYPDELKAHTERVYHPGQ